MIDFLFLMVAFFACLALSRASTKQLDIQLVKVQDQKQKEEPVDFYDYKMITVQIDKNNQYKWVTEIRDYDMPSVTSIVDELDKQYQKGLLPEDKTRTQVLLKIDRDAKWEFILKALFAIRDAGFEVRPVYEPFATTLSTDLLEYAH